MQTQNSNRIERLYTALTVQQLRDFLSEREKLDVTFCFRVLLNGIEIIPITNDKEEFDNYLNFTHANDRSLMVYVYSRSLVHTTYILAFDGVISQQAAEQTTIQVDRETYEQLVQESTKKLNLVYLNDIGISPELLHLEQLLNNQQSSTDEKNKSDRLSIHFEQNGYTVFLPTSFVNKVLKNGYEILTTQNPETAVENALLELVKSNEQLKSILPFWEKLMSCFDDPKKVQP